MKISSKTRKMIEKAEHHEIKTGAHNLTLT